MKTLVIILSAIGLLSLNSCKQETDPQALMENPETRTVVFSTIMENQDYMIELMSQMQNSEQAMQMMQDNKKMMGSMMQGEGMQMMMMDNKQMRHSMMYRMMNNEKMMGPMIIMMQKKGIMSEDCMQSSMKMMSDKGMDMQGMNKMDDMDSRT
jgi:hypothetical protein